MRAASAASSLRKLTVPLEGDVYSIPLATNMGTAEILVRTLDEGVFEFRDLLRGEEPNV